MIKTDQLLPSENLHLNRKEMGVGFLVAQYLRLHAFQRRGPRPAPGQGAKISHAVWHSQKIKKKKVRKFHFGDEGGGKEVSCKECHTC